MPLRMSSLLRVFSALALFCIAGNAAAAGDAERGKYLSYTCLGCHGIANYKNVYPTYSVPKLRGQHPEYLVTALKAYKVRERSHGTMHAQAVSLTDQDMEDIAIYFAGTPLKAGAASTGNAPAKVTELCVACHGKDGVGITVEYPSIGGQHADYLQRTLEEYKNGGRKNAVMPAFVSTLSGADMKLIAEFYAEQRPALGTVKLRTWIYSPQ